MTDRKTVAMDGFAKVRPITEGHEVKGGVNTASRITTRPPPPQPMRPAATSSTAQPPAKGK